MGTAVHNVYRRILPNEELTTISNSNGNILGILDKKGIIRGLYNTGQKRVIISLATGKSRRIVKEEINQVPAGRTLRLKNFIEVPGIYHLPLIE